MSQTCVIIGASHAAAQLAPTLRQEGWQGRIIVIGDEAHIPYHRPPLSKTYLSGEKTMDEIYIRPAAVYEKAEVEFLLNTRVDSIDRQNKTLSLNNGDSIAYDKLALTLGSRVRKVDLPGVELDGIYYLRDAADVEKIKTKTGAGKKAVIVGGGYIGLETAAVLRKLGMEVTVLEMMERVLQRVTAPEISEFYNRIHTEEGVNICCGVGVSAFEGNVKVEKVICSNDDTYEADLVVVGVGILPNVELAEAAELEVNNGIVVDEYARTSDEDIVAAGDCTFHYNSLYEKDIRLESVQNATDQARVAALTLCGKAKAYDALPWFWSDQYDLKLQIAGLSQGYDEVIVRGDRQNSRSFAVFYLKDGKVISVDAINKAAEFMVGKRLISGKLVVDKAKLADENVSMKELIS
jgi:3-phenylpropionate/trans-cinnamate dioxygenase ferredoxin reductase component